MPGDFYTCLGGERGKDARAQRERAFQSHQVVASLRGYVAAYAPLIRLQRPSQLSFYAAAPTFGATEWAKRVKEFDDEEELEAFAVRKVSQLNEYDKALEKREEDKALADSGKITK